MVTNEQHAEQTQDIETSWLDGRMLRNPREDGAMDVVVIAKGKVYADFIAWSDADGDHRLDVQALYSRVGERYTEKYFVERKWRKAKDVKYNTLTGDIVLA